MSLYIYIYIYICVSVHSVKNPFQFHSTGQTSGQNILRFRKLLSSLTKIKTYFDKDDLHDMLLAFIMQVIGGT